VTEQPRARPYAITVDPLAGGGEMGALMRAIDWSRTPVGAPDRWPQSLRTALSILLETGFPMYIAWGPDYTQFYNDGYRPILGSTKHPALGRSTRETFAEIWDIIGPMFDGVMQGTPTTVVDFLLPLDRHGFVEECYFIFSYSPIRQERGDVGGVLVTVTETTERVLGARRLRTLQDLAARTRHAASAEDACAIAGAVLGANPADLPFAAIYLLDRDGTSARLQCVSGALPPAGIGARIDVGAADWPLAAALETGTPHLMERLPPGVFEGVGGMAGARALVLPVAQQGEPTPRALLVAGLSPRLMLDDAYRSFLALVADHIGTAIAGAIALQEAEARARALAELDRAKTVFFSNVSHEFRTPLTLMLGPTENALRSPDSALRGEDLRIVHRNELRLLKLVNTLLEFSRIEAGRIQAQYQRTDLGAVTLDLASMFRSAIERAGLRLDAGAYDVPADVWVDRDMWEKIVLNLISNALKHTFEGGIKVEVRGTAGGAELMVADTGVGIAPEQLPHVFERFHRIPAARARTHEGTGIGLALVDELVRLHGGTIQVESTVGAGTTFRIIIPTGTAHLPQDRVAESPPATTAAIGAAAFVEEALRWLPEAPADHAPGPSAAAHPASGHGAPRHRVLIADDNSDMRGYVAELLGREFDVDTAVDGLDALERFRRRTPALVVADVMMPGMDGLALLSAIRADPDRGHTPVVLLSARAGEEARVEGLEAGADDYLVKPFSARELIATVRAHVALAVRRREFEERERVLERKAADATAELDRVLASVGEGVVVLDHEFRYVYANAAAEQLVPLRREEVLGRRPWEVFPPEVIEDAMRHLREAAATSRVARYEVYLPGVDRWYENRAYPANGSMTIFFNDITVRRRAEEARRRNVDARRLLAAVTDATRASGDPDQAIRTVVRLTGRHFRAGRCAFGEIDPDGDAMVVAHDYTEGMPGIAGRHRLSHMSADLVGELQQGRTVAVADVHEDARAAGARDAFAPLEARAVLCAPLVRSARLEAVLLLHHPQPRTWSAEDVHLLEQVAQRTWLAVEHARAEAAVRESRDVLALAMRGARMGAWSRSLPDGEVWWSRELEEIFGIEPGGFARTRDGFLDFVHEDDRGRLNAAVRSAIASGDDYVVEFRFRHGSGEWRWMEGRGRAVYAADGTATSLYGLGIDVTGRKRTEEALAAARDAAESANRVKDQFLATLSHELRTPLNAILGYTRMLRRGAIPEEKRERALEVIERNAAAQAQLVEDLLDISRITSGKVRLELAPLPAAAPLREALESVRPAAEAKGVEVAADIDPFAGTVRADATRLQQVFWNLLSNAVKFTPAGGRVTVHLVRAGDAIVGTVADTGIGIPAEFLPLVFEPFRQADARPAREHSGLGLGLAICRQLVELHGGTIDVRSDGPGRGSAFTVRLPRHETRGDLLDAYPAARPGGE
jgi:PAS domain S-box-containing protein